MAQRITFMLQDSEGNPLEDQVPSIINYRKADGTSASPVPTVVDKGQGFYEFAVDAESTGPVAYVVGCGNQASVQYMVGSCGELVAFMMYDEDGNPDAAGSPAFSVYGDDASALTPPALVNLSGGLFGFVPVPAPGRLVRYRVGNTHSSYWGTVGSTSLTNASPAAESIIETTQVITLDVLDTESELGRVLIAVEYAGAGGATELAWDGTRAVGPFVVTPVPIVNGRRYSVLRKGGWPWAPTVRVFLTNLGGREI